MHCGGGCLCVCGDMRGARPSRSQKWLNMLQVCGGSCSSLRGCGGALVGADALLGSGCAGRPCCCSTNVQMIRRRPRTARQPARFASTSGRCWQALRAGGSAMQPTRKTGSVLARGPVQWSHSRSWQGVFSNACSPQGRGVRPGGVGVLLPISHPKFWFRRACKAHDPPIRP